MFDVILSLSISFTISFLAIPVIINVAEMKKLYDMPDARKIHHVAITPLGGIGIFAGFIFGCLLTINFQNSSEFQYFVAATLVIFFLGLKDDILVLSPIKKFIGQVLAAFLIVYKGGIQIKSMHGFFGLEGPLPEMYSGDFSNFRNASNAIIPIYDPLTQCGTAGNGACAAGQTIQRQVFPGNIVPKNRFDPVGNALAAFPLVALPNQPGDAFTHNNNYSALASKGGDNDQVNGRLDYSVSDKLRLFARFSRWHSTNLAFAPFHNGIYANDPYAPEEFTTTQGVLGSTYLITPTLVLDLRASYIRFPYIRSQSFENISLSKTFGFPKYMDEQLPIIHSGPGTSIPSVSIGGYNTASGLHILSTENDYLLTPNLS